MAKQSPVKTITEPARKIKVWREADVVVVGGGPGGVGSAIAAARSGAKTVLIERYGHLGGMATGGLVNIIPTPAINPNTASIRAGVNLSASQPPATPNMAMQTNSIDCTPEVAARLQPNSVANGLKNTPKLFSTDAWATIKSVLTPTITHP